MFFNDGESADVITTFELNCTHQLKEAVAAHTSKLTRWKVGKQALYFSKLTRALKGSKSENKKRVKAVLDWYCKQLQAKSFKGPEVSSPRQFSDRWDWIADLYDKAHVPEEVEVPISNEAISTYSQVVGRGGWPYTKDEMLQAIQKSLTELTRIRKAMVKAQGIMAMGDQKMESLARIVENLLPQLGSGYAANWYRRLHDTIVGTGNNQMKLSNHLIHFDHKWLEDTCKKSITAYTGSVGKWEAIKKIIKEQL